MLHETKGPFEGTMSIVYGCSQCGHGMALLTNKMETQMVRSLGVKIGGRSDEAAPMEMVRTNLVGRRESVPVPEPEEKSASKCPFTGVVAEAFAAEPAVIEWTDEAKARMERIPSFVRPMVEKYAETYAKDHGLATVDEAVVDAIKGRVG